MNSYKMNEAELVEHLNTISKNILKLEILLLTLTDELEKQGFVVTKEILEKADEEYEDAIFKVKAQVETKIEEIKKDLLMSNIFYGAKGEA